MTLIYIEFVQNLWFSKVKLFYCQFYKKKSKHCILQIVTEFKEIKFLHLGAEDEDEVPVQNVSVLYLQKN